MVQLASKRGGNLQAAPATEDLLRPFIDGGSWALPHTPGRIPQVHDERRDGLQILDVRERDEWEAGHIPESVFMPYHDIHALPDIDPERPVAVICASGQRAAVGASNAASLRHSSAGMR